MHLATWPLHDHQIWNADTPWQPLLLSEPACLCETQHCLADVLTAMAYRLHPVFPIPPAISCCRLACCSFNSSLPSRLVLCQPWLSLATGAVCTEQGSLFLMPGSHARVPAASLALPPHSRISSIESSLQQPSQHQTMSTILRLKPTNQITSDMRNKFMQHKHEHPSRTASEMHPLTKDPAWPDRQQVCS